MDYFEFVMLYAMGVMTGIFFSILAYHHDWGRLIFVAIWLTAAFAAMPYLHRRYRRWLDRRIRSSPDR